MRFLLIKLIALEYLICGAFVMVSSMKHIIDESKMKDELIVTQQEIIKTLSDKLTNDSKIIIPENKVERIDINYKSKTEIVDDKEFLGNFKITHYCACKKCCGQNAQGITASGKKVEEGKTIAVDPKVIKLGSKVEINGHVYEAQDTGSAIKGNIIDIYVSEHNEALKLGVKHADVYLVK